VLATRERKLYIVSIAGVDYGIDAAFVAGTFEIDRPFTPIPGSPSHVLGLHAWNGIPLAVVDPRSFLGVSTDSAFPLGHVSAVILRFGATHVAVVADNVIGPRAISEKSAVMLDPATLLGDDSRSPKDALADLRTALWEHASFAVSDINLAWIMKRHRTAKSRRVPLATRELVSEFLSGFSSPCIDSPWSESLRSELLASMPRSTSRPFTIWNHGCGRGLDAISIACILALDRPRLRVKIWADDDVRMIGEAQKLVLPGGSVPGYLRRSGLVVAKGEQATVVSRIRDTILFISTEALVPFSGIFDMIICRDRLSHMEETAKAASIDAFTHALHSGGTLITGIHERMPVSEWIETRPGKLPCWKMRTNRPH
jgi:chemotaxis methyl-accepting protein methylase/chemotaxis signal transduction protein